MEKLTISRVGAERTVKTKYGDKIKQGVIFREYTDIWHDVWQGGLKEGQVLEGERASRDWEGKTYWSLNLPKKGTVDAGKIEEIITKLNLLQNSVEQIAKYLDTNMVKRTSSGAPVPDFTHDTMNLPDDIFTEDVPF